MLTHEIPTELEPTPINSAPQNTPVEIEDVLWGGHNPARPPNIWKIPYVFDHSHMTEVDTTQSTQKNYRIDHK